MEYLSKKGLERLWQHIIAKLGEKVNKEEGKGLSSNDFTTEEKNKLASLSASLDSEAIAAQINSAMQEFTIVVSDDNNGNVFMNISHGSIVNDDTTYLAVNN